MQRAVSNNPQNKSSFQLSDTIIQSYEKKRLTAWTICSSKKVYSNNNFAVPFSKLVRQLFSKHFDGAANDFSLRFAFC